MRRQPAFSLLEMIVVVALLAVLAGLGLILTGGQRASSSTRSAALALAEELRSARRRAVSQGVPVGVAFPSQNGAVALAEGYYLLEGDINPRIRRVIRAATDGSVGFFTGTWATTEAVTRAMPPGGTRIAFDTWNAPQPADSMLVFLPSGRVVSNGLARHADNFHVVVTAGATTGGTVTPPGSPGLAAPAAVFDLTGAASPNTVLISPAGSVSVTEGLPGATAAVTLASGRLNAPLAALPAVSPPVSAAPVISKVTVDPPGGGGVEALASGERTISLITEAQSPEGALLFCRWTCAEGGAFGSAEAQRMQWDPARGAYVSSWSYRPVGLAASAPFTLQCEVRDEFGNLATEAAAGLASVTGQAGAPTDELVVKRTVGGKVGIWTVTSDLSSWNLVVDETSFQNFSDFESAIVSPEGERLILAVRAPAPRVYTVNFDGSGLKLLVSALGSGSPRPYALSPDGTTVAANTNSGVYFYPLNGTPTIAANLVRTSLAWSPDSTKLFVLPSAGGGAVILDRPTSTVSPVTLPAGVTFPSQALWPDPNTLLLTGMSAGITVYKLDVSAGTNSVLVNLGNTLTDAINLSRDNLEICASVSVPGGPVIQAGDRLIRQPIAGGAASFINPTPLVHNGHYTKDGLRLYCSAEQGGNWAVYRCNLDGSAGSLLLPGCKLFGIK